MAMHEGAPGMYRADMCASLNHFWKLPANSPYDKESPGFHISRTMEEVAKEEGWVFAYHVRPNGSRYDIHWVFPSNLANNKSSLVEKIIDYQIAKYGKAA